MQRTRFRCSAITSHSHFNLHSCLACDFRLRMFIPETACNREKNNGKRRNEKKIIIKKKKQQNKNIRALPFRCRRNDIFLLIIFFLRLSLRDGLIKMPLRSWSVWLCERIRNSITSSFSSVRGQNMQTIKDERATKWNRKENRILNTEYDIYMWV